MAGAILLLLTGNQILNWYWIALLVVGAIGVGVYRMRSRIPSAYTLAQRIDRRLHLADALSTATYFSSPEAQHTRTEASFANDKKQKPRRPRAPWMCGLPCRSRGRVSRIRRWVWPWSRWDCSRCASQ
jgi:hypothetical protein